MVFVFCRGRRRSRSCLTLIFVTSALLLVCLAVMTSFVANVKNHVLDLRGTVEQYTNTKSALSTPQLLRASVRNGLSKLSSEEVMSFNSNGDQTEGPSAKLSSPKATTIPLCSSPKTDALHLDASRIDLPHVTVELPAVVRLGNQMFAHASLLGIARRNDLLPAISTRENNAFLVSTFELETPLLKYPPNYKNCSGGIYPGWMTFTERLPCTYDQRNEELRHFVENETTTNVLLSGYFQSYRYFHDYRDDIIREFRFKTLERQVAFDYLQDLRKKYCKRRGAQRNECLTVGVHVRLSDMAGEDAKDQGYTTATADYIVNAMTFMERRFNTSRLIFIISSDNITWCQTAVKYKTLQPFVFFTQERQVGSAAKWPDSVNLSILAACDHSIITVGTFGWWAGYLAGGLTVYYKDFPKPGSRIDKEFRAADFFPPEWIGLT